MMNKLVYFVLIISASILISCKENATTKTAESPQTVSLESRENPNQLNRTMYISADGGLRMRDKPSTDGSKIVTIPDKSEVLLTEETGDTITISGKNGRWSKIKYEKYEGWVFGGFLVESKPPLIKIPKELLGWYSDSLEEPSEEDPCSIGGLRVTDKMFGEYGGCTAGAAAICIPIKLTFTNNEERVYSIDCSNEPPCKAEDIEKGYEGCDAKVGGHYKIIINNKGLLVNGFQYYKSK